MMTVTDTRRRRIRTRASDRAQRRLRALLETGCMTTEPAAALYVEAERLVDRIDGRPGLFAFRPLTEPELDALAEAYHEQLADMPLAYLPDGVSYDPIPDALASYWNRGA